MVYGLNNLPMADRAHIDKAGKFRDYHTLKARSFSPMKMFGLFIHINAHLYCRIRPYFDVQVVFCIDIILCMHTCYNCAL